MSTDQRSPDYTRAGIVSSREELESILAAAHRQLSLLREECPHPELRKVARSNVGHYDPSADKYWYDFDCEDCGKHWSTPQ